MSITRQEAAAARAAAAQRTEAAERLSALEVERAGYVQRGNAGGVEAVDEEIAHWSQVAGIPVESGPADDTTPEGEGAGEAPTDDGPADGTAAEETDTPAAKPAGRAKAAATAAKD